MDRGASLKICSREQGSSADRGVKTGCWDYENPRPPGLEEEILRVAIQLELTAHDSPYVVLAMENGLILVTEDRKLQEKRKLIKAISSDEVATLD
jgi:hypothetical protein